MSIKLTKSVSGCSVLFVCIAALVSTTCGSTQSSPTAPTSSATPAATPAPTPAAPAATGKVEIVINPDPVQFSGQAITDTPSCAGSKNTWFYDQILKEVGGADVTFTARVDSFDDRVVNNVTSGLNIPVPARGSLTLHARWCSATAAAHTAQTTFSGVDANGHAVSAAGPVARLMAPGR
jgi:hypothetical protein